MSTVSMSTANHKVSIQDWYIIQHNKMDSSTVRPYKSRRTDALARKRSPEICSTNTIQIFTVKIYQIKRDKQT